jgi:hypothetical protein
MVRCGDCYRRQVRPMSMHLRKKRESLYFDHEKAVMDLTATVREESGKEMVTQSSSGQRIA